MIKSFKRPLSCFILIYLFGYIFLYRRDCPWLTISRTIFDINIEALEQKPWRQPEVDITDYFNFDLNEESWRSYCRELVNLADIMLIFFLKLPDHLHESENFFFQDQFRQQQTEMSEPFIVSESSRPNQV